MGLHSSLAHAAAHLDAMHCLALFVLRSSAHCAYALYSHVSAYTGTCAAAEKLVPFCSFCRLIVFTLPFTPGGLLLGGCICALESGSGKYRVVRRERRGAVLHPVSHS